MESGICDFVVIQSHERVTNIHLGQQRKFHQRRLAHKREVNTRNRLAQMSSLDCSSFPLSVLQASKKNWPSDLLVWRQLLFDGWKKVQMNAENSFESMIGAATKKCMDTKLTLNANKIAFMWTPIRQSNFVLLLSLKTGDDKASWFRTLFNFKISSFFWRNPAVFRNLSCFFCLNQVF